MKNVLITGATSGLGYALAAKLLQKNQRVIIAGRDTCKLNEVQEKLAEEAEEETFEALHLDLASFASIHKAVNNLVHAPDVLVCNAAIAYESEARFTEDGFEETFQVNYLGHFLLTQLLLKKFPRSLKRIIVVSSNAHDPARTKGFFPSPHFKEFKEMAYERNPHYRSTRRQGALRYVHSKLCEIMFTYELHRRLRDEEANDSIKINAFHPGFIPETGLARERSDLNKFVLKYIMPGMRLFISEITTAEHAADKMVPLILHSPSTGKYFHGPKPVPSSMLSYNQELWAQLWKQSMDWAGLTRKDTIFEL